MTRFSDANLRLKISRYLSKRAAGTPWTSNASPSHSFSGAVVIPSLAESVNLPQTLESLSLNPADLLDHFIFLVVVNHCVDASGAEKADNHETLKMLPFWKQRFGLKHLLWVDAASAGSELPAGQGVGLARKIGLDLALPLLNCRDDDPLLICLDADTLVQADYLPAIIRHFEGASAGGASIPYRHQSAADPAGQCAIDRYELFLRTYVLGLQLAGSPYAFHTVGSAMACRASAYVAAGGMNRRCAGEDFYFLQQIHKTSGVASLFGTVVHPSPRASQRVPFGTGRAVGDMLAEGEQRLLFYQPIVFSILAEWLTCVAENTGADGSVLLSRADRISPFLGGFLKQADFSASWDKLRRNNPEQARVAGVFHGWFDAFRSMRLIHHLSAHAYPRIAPGRAVPPLLERAGVVSPDTVEGQLELLRTLQHVV
ncbi:MAG: glycosyltransferase family 2 protein [Desulfuromonadales bacterium]